MRIATTLLDVVSSVPFWIASVCDADRSRIAAFDKSTRGATGSHATIARPGAAHARPDCEGAS